MRCTLVRPEPNSDPQSIVLPSSGLERKPVLPSFHSPFQGPCTSPQIIDYSQDGQTRAEQNVQDWASSALPVTLSLCGPHAVGARKKHSPGYHPRRSPDAGVWWRFSILFCRMVGRSLGRLAVDKGLHWPSSPPGQRGWSRKYPGLLRTQASHSATGKSGGWVQKLRSPSTRASDPTASSSPQPRPLSAWPPLLLP